MNSFLKPSWRLIKISIISHVIFYCGFLMIILMKLLESEDLSRYFTLYIPFVLTGYHTILLIVNVLLVILIKKQLSQNITVKNQIVCFSSIWNLASLLIVLPIVQYIQARVSARSFTAYFEQLIEATRTKSFPLKIDDASQILQDLYSAINKVSFFLNASLIIFTIGTALIWYYNWLLINHTSNSINDNIHQNQNTDYSSID